PDANQQHPIPVFGGQGRGFKVARQLEAALEIAVGNFHAVVTTILLFHAAAALATHSQSAAADVNRNVLGPDAGEVEFDQPAMARPVDVGGRVPGHFLEGLRRRQEEGVHEADQVSAHGRKSPFEPTGCSPWAWDHRAAPATTSSRTPLSARNASSRAAG